MRVSEGVSIIDWSAVDDIRTFLVVLATELRETIVKFEETTDRVTELSAAHAARADRNLVVALQSFDRLRQEFATFADVLAMAAAKSPESWLRAAHAAHPAEDAVASVPMAELKQRLLRHLGAAVPEIAEPQASDEAVF